MYPFVRKIRKMQKKHRMGEVAEEWRWLGEWRTALNEDDLEKVSEQGEQDAEVGRFGRRALPGRFWRVRVVLICGLETPLRGIRRTTAGTSERFTRTCCRMLPSVDANPTA
jgi:hypothetical protein